MGFFRRAADKLSPSRSRSKSGGGSSAPIDPTIANHLTEFVRTRRGVEAYVEPQTIITQTTILLVAWDGEWTRRRVPSPRWAYSFAESLQIPGYDALVVGYPQRMRDYNSRLSRKVDGPEQAVPGAPAWPIQPASGQAPGSDFADRASEQREFIDDLEQEYQLPPSTHEDPRDLR
jgi:hypothetical protein